MRDGAPLMETVPGPDVATGVGTAPVGRRRRPSGEAPPLPRRVDRTMRLYLVLAAFLLALWVALWTRPGQAAVTRVDLVVVHAVAKVRTGVLTSAMRAAAALGSTWTVRIVAWSTIAVLLVVRRFQHLAAYLVVLLAVAVVSTTAMAGVGRMRPAGVTLLGPWQGYANPSVPVAALALVLAGALYTLAPSGRARNAGKIGALVALVTLCAARLYLGVDHPTDLAAALVVGWAVPVVAFRLLVPEEAFPISYRGGRRAHLDVTGRRHEAIIKALDDQLGLDAVGIEPFGLEASAGSTPLRIRVRGHGDEPDRTLFGKLYAVNHLRSDRWYKLTRTIVYGRLEDEKPFSSVRRLVEYEDHMLRLMRDAGLPTPAPYGFVEITPEREYVIVMEFFDDARPILDERLGETAIDDGLSVVRRLWDAGLAHRDIKPSNLLVRDDRVLLIDVAFAAVRPTPWRQAVDLADMMLTLALCSTPGLVYERALLRFSPDDVAEAFAACRSVTIPTQLRARLRADDRDLPTAFRALAPSRSPVAIQLWNARRVAVTAGVLALVALAFGLLVAYTQVAGLVFGGQPVAGGVPKCSAARRVAVVAQSVPTAAYVPCLGELGEGWRATNFDPRRYVTRYSLVSDRAPDHPVDVIFARTCNSAGAVPTTPSATGVRTSIRLRSISPRYAGTMYDVFPGGCVTTTFDFARGPHIALIEGVDSAMALLSRQQLRLDVHRALGVELDP